jgi:hypothetical protein
MAAPATRTTVSSGDLASYASALLHAIARDEAMGRRPARLTEAGLATWQRFRGRLGSGELLQLLAEDGAVVHPLPFDPARVRAPFDLRQVDDELVDAFVAALPTLALTQPAAEYIDEQAKRLGVTPRLARSELHQVKSHQKVLELPGTGGLLSHHLVATQDALSLHQQPAPIACGTAGSERDAGRHRRARPRARRDTDFVVAATAADLTRPARAGSPAPPDRRFDFVVGRPPRQGRAAPTPPTSSRSGSHGAKHPARLTDARALHPAGGAGPRQRAPGARGSWSTGSPRPTPSTATPGWSSARAWSTSSTRSSSRRTRSTSSRSRATAGTVEGTDNDWYSPTSRSRARSSSTGKTAQILHGLLKRVSFAAGQLWTQGLVFLSATNPLQREVAPASRDRIHTRASRCIAALHRSGVRRSQR